MIRDRLRAGAQRVKNGISRRLKGAEVVVHAKPVAAPVPPRSPLADVPEPVMVEESDDTVGPALTMESVAALFEDMVRPALKSDGGDIDLVRVEGGNVYVRLLGACNGCPSSSVTMTQGIERLLIEEFPQFDALIQVHDPR